MTQKLLTMINAFFKKLMSSPPLLLPPPNQRIRGAPRSLGGAPKKTFPSKVVLDTKNSKIINFSDHFALFCAFLYQHDHKILDFASKSHKVVT